MKKLSLLFALLCASMMGWAYTSDPDTWIGTTDATYANQFKWSVLDGVATPNDVVNIQQPGFATAIGIYMNFADAAFDGIYMNGTLATNGTEYKQDGAGIVVYLSALTAKNTEVLIKQGSTTRFGLNIYNDKGSGGGSTPEPGTDPDPTPVDPNALTAGGHTIHLDASYVGDIYTLVITSTDAMEGLGGSFWNVSGVGTDMRSNAGTNSYTISGDKKTITCQVQSSSAPNIYTPLYVLMPGEVNFGSVTLNWEDRTPINSEYCNSKKSSDNTEAAFTWETDDNGNVKITISETLGGAADATYFRGNGITADKFTIGANKDPITTYFTHPGEIAGQQTLTLTLTDPANAPAKGTKIYIDNKVIEYATSKDGNAWPYLTFEYTYGGICNGLDAPANVAVSVDSIITFDAVSGAETYTAYVYLNGVLKYDQEVTSGDVLHFFPLKTATYQVNVVASAEGKTDSDPSDDADWTLTKRDITLDNSEYCEHVVGSGNTEAAITWVTNTEGSIIITLTETLGGAEGDTHFRNPGMNLTKFKVGYAREDASVYFNHACSNGTTVTLSLKDANIAPAEGEKIYFDGYLEYNTSKQTGMWPAIPFEYTYGTVCSGKAVSATPNNYTMGTAVVKKGDDVVTSVENGDEVSFIATVADAELYRFVNWTKGGNVVSTNATYVTTITESTNLVANFDYIRNTYCHTEILSNASAVQGKKLYMTLGSIGGGKYMIKYEGSAEAPFTSLNNANYTVNRVTTEIVDGDKPMSGQDVPFTDARWSFDDSGYGSVSMEFGIQEGYTWEDIYVWNHYIYLNTPLGVLGYSGFPDRYHIAWTETCADEEAPVINKAEAEILNATDIRLTLKATDNWDGMLTYTISRENADDIVLHKASGEEFTQDVTGLTPAEYTFHVTVSDGTNNAETNINATIVADDVKPVMTSASLTSSTYTTVVIAVAATDNVGVVGYHVVETTHSIDSNYVASEGTITIEGLTHATDYNFAITALDLAGNESETPISVPVTTPFDGSINLALNKTCEGGYYDNNPTESADKVNDGNENSAWVTYANQPASVEWWVVDLGEVYAISNITTVWGGNQSTKYILQSRVEAPNTDDKANDAAWVTMATVTGAEANSTKSTDLSGIGRYIRFRSIERNGECIRLKELRVFGTGKVAADTEKPVMVSASLVSNTDSHAIINVSATDNVGIASYHVVDAGNSIDANYAPEDGKITVTGLTGGTNYTLLITAVDFFGNESDNNKSVEVTTTAHFTVPQAVCPAPTWDASLVKAMYSPTYSADYTHQDWGSGTVASKDDFGRKYVTNGNGYFGADGFSLNCLMMEKLHYDIWIENDATIRFVPIWGGAEQGITKNLTGQEWNSIDIDLTAYTGITNWGNIYQMKIDQASNLTFWVANAYFYREAAYVDTEAPTNVSASVTAEGFYSVKISAQAEDNSGAVSFKVMNGEEILATGAAATGVAATITVNGLASGTAYNLNVIAYDEAGNAAAPIAVAATTKAVPASAPAPVTSGKVIVPVYSDALAGALTGIQTGGWGESTQAEWLNIASGDQVFYMQNFNWAGWHSWGASIDATDMMFLHVDFYSTGMTQVSVTPISPGHEGVANCTLTPNAWTSVDVPLSAYAANNIDMGDIFQFKFMNPVGGNELMIDNVYFWQPKVTALPVQGEDPETGGWATFSCAEKVAVPEGLTAYKAAYSKTETEEVLTLTSVSVIPANAGVILRGTAGQDYVFSATAADAPDMSNNNLVGCPVRTDVSAVRESNDIFCMRYSELFSMTGFFIYEGQYVPAGKAYLALPKPTQPSSAPRRVRFVLNNEQVATGMDAMQTQPVEATKFIENGQLFIRRGDAVYTIQGTRVQ